MVHPLHTQAVTYIIQRCESMMGLCYLLTTYCTLRDAIRTALGLVSDGMVLLRPRRRQQGSDDYRPADPGGV